MRHGALTFLLMGWALCLLACTVRVEPADRSGEAALSRLVSQRVTATVERNAERLVRLETERETFLTTPEHPFATPRSGWIPAGQLVPGDALVSASFGTLRIISVRSETPAHPVAVFNLTVDPSHAYLVGNGQVLVHNKKCRVRESESLEDALARNVAEREELNRQLASLNETLRTAGERAAEIQARIDDLKRQRKERQNDIRHLKAVLLKKRGVPAPTPQQRRRQLVESANLTARMGLEAARKALLELENRPSPETAQRRAELERELKSHQLDYDHSNEILALERELVELEERSPNTAAERVALENQKRLLSERIAGEKEKLTNRKYRRKQRTEPEKRRRDRLLSNEAERRRLRSKTYQADAERPRDRLELLEQELAELHQTPESESRDERIQHLTELIESKKRLVALNREAKAIEARKRYWKRTLAALVSRGPDTSNGQQKLAAAERDQIAVRTKQAQQQVKIALLEALDRTAWTDAPRAVDEARLRELEQQLAEGALDDRQLTEIERELGAADEPLDEEFFEQVWRESAAQEAALHESQDVDSALSALVVLLQRSPSPERDAGLHSGFQRLQQELREERSALEAVNFELVNEFAHIQTTQASSSSGATWQQRLKAIQDEQARLREQWRARLQARLDHARQRLDAMRRVPRLSDEAAEAELASEISLLAHELQNPVF
jgi:hypothetical protein